MASAFIMLVAAVLQFFNGFDILYGSTIGEVTPVRSVDSSNEFGQSDSSYWVAQVLRI